MEKNDVLLSSWLAKNCIKINTKGYFFEIKMGLLKGYNSKDNKTGVLYGIYSHGNIYDDLINVLRLSIKALKY